MVGTPARTIASMLTRVTSPPLFESSASDSGNLGDTEASKDQLIPQPRSEQNPEGRRVFVTCSGEDVDDHLERLLECPVCYDMILPPIISCVSGHSSCEGCRKSLKCCPVCRGNFTDVRNLFAEQFLEKCIVKCKHVGHGCQAVLPAKELASHYSDHCEFRPIRCRECDVLVVFDEYLDHISTKDKIERQKASECSTGFEIDEVDLMTRGGGERQAIWEPTWMSCYGQNFFCTLENSGDWWWIWVSSMTEAGCKFKGQILLWNREKGSELSYTGRIHSIRSNPNEVLETGECLMMRDKVLKSFIYMGGIDVVVRIERIYNPPKTRRGNLVESPLEIILRKNLQNAQGNPNPTELPAFATPSRALRTNNPRGETGGIMTRIPTATATSTVSPLEVRSASRVSTRRQTVISDSSMSIPSSSGDEDRRGATRYRGGSSRRLHFDSSTHSVVAPATPSSGRTPRSYNRLTTRRGGSRTPRVIEVVDVEE